MRLEVTDSLIPLYQRSSFLVVILIDVDFVNVLGLLAYMLCGFSDIFYFVGNRCDTRFDLRFIGIVPFGN